MDGNEFQVIASELRLMVHDLEKRCANIEEKCDRTERRLELAEAVGVERREKNKDTLARIFAHLAKHDEVISRIVWLVIGAIISAFVAFMLTGGLNAAS